MRINNENIVDKTIFSRYNALGYTFNIKRGCKQWVYLIFSKAQLNSQAIPSLHIIQTKADRQPKSCRLKCRGELKRVRLWEIIQSHIKCLNSPNSNNSSQYADAILRAAWKESTPQHLYWIATLCSQGSLCLLPLNTASIFSIRAIWNRPYILTPKSSFPHTKPAENLIRDRLGDPLAGER